MKSVLTSLSVPSNHPAMKLLSTYNMASTCEARIVSSQPSLRPIIGWSEIEKVGLGRLSKVVRDIMGVSKKEGVTLEAQVGTLKAEGQLNDDSYQTVSVAGLFDGIILTPMASATSYRLFWS
jgi:hypothetical protein